MSDERDNCHYCGERFFVTNLGNHERDCELRTKPLAALSVIFIRNDGPCKIAVRTQETIDGDEYVTTRTLSHGRSATCTLHEKGQITIDVITENTKK